MKSFKSFISEAYNIPLSSDKDIESFEGKLSSAELKKLLKIASTHITGIPLVGDSNGTVKIRTHDDKATQAIKKYYKGNLPSTVKFGLGSLKSTNGINWSTDVLETVQCLGVYIDGADILGAIKDIKSSNELTRVILPFGDKIKKILSNGQDWDSGGSSKLLTYIDKGVNLEDWVQIGSLMNGMKRFADGPGKGLTNIIHGSINTYYNAEESNQTVKGEKNNTADMILTNVSSSELIKAVSTEKVEFNAKGICLIGNIKFVQVSLKKSAGGAQLGKVTSAIITSLGIDSYSNMLDQLISEGWFDKVKSFGRKVLGAVKGFLKKAVNFGTTFLKNMSRAYQRQEKKDIAELEKLMGLNEGYLSDLPNMNILSEASKLTFADKLTSLNKAQISKIRTAVNERIDTLLRIGNDNAHMKTKITGRIKAGRNKLSSNEIIKLFANYTTLYILGEMLNKSNNESNSLRNDLIMIQKEMFFGKTMLPLYKVYGSGIGGRSFEFLKSGQEWVDDKTKDLDKDDIIILGALASQQDGKYYTMYSSFVSGIDDEGMPIYSLNRMGTNASGRFSYIIEGTNTLTHEEFIRKFT